MLLFQDEPYEIEKKSYIIKKLLIVVFIDIFFNEWGKINRIDHFAYMMRYDERRRVRMRRGVIISYE